MTSLLALETTNVLVAIAGEVADLVTLEANVLSVAASVAASVTASVTSVTTTVTTSVTAAVTAAVTTTVTTTVATVVTAVPRLAFLGAVPTDVTSLVTVVTGSVTAAVAGTTLVAGAAAGVAAVAAIASLLSVTTVELAGVTLPFFGAISGDMTTLLTVVTGAVIATSAADVFLCVLAFERLMPTLTTIEALHPFIVLPVGGQSNF